MKPRRSTIGSEARLGLPAIGEAGNTLLELLVVLTIVGLLLAVATPRLSDTVNAARLRTTAHTVATSLRDTRTAALNQAASAKLSINLDGRRYTVAGKTVTLPSAQTIAYQATTQITESPQNIAELEFLPDGSSNGGTITLAQGRSRVRILVDWLTGRVSVHD